MEKESENAVAFLYTLAAKLNNKALDRKYESQLVQDVLFIASDVAAALAETLEVTK